MTFLQPIFRSFLVKAVCVYFIIPGLCLADSVFKITPQVSQFYLKPNMATSKPVYFTVSNVSGATIPGLSFEANYISNDLFTSDLADSSGPRKCKNGQSLLTGAECILDINLIAGESFGSQDIMPRVCGFFGWLCSYGKAEVNIVDTRVGKVVGSITTPLPNNTEIDTPTPVVFSFKNNSATLSATNVKVTEGFSEITVESDECSGQQLLPGNSCEVGCQFKSSTQGSIEPFVTFSYNEGPDVIVQAKTRVVDVAVQGEVKTSLPSYVKQGDKVSVAFKFTNMSSLGSAKGVTAKISTTSGTWEELSNTCKGSVISSGVCTVLGKVNFSSKGAQAVAVTLNYDQGDPIELTTNTMVSDIVVGGFGLSLHAGAMLEDEKIILTGRNQDQGGLISSDGRLDFDKAVQVKCKLSFSIDLNPGAADGIAFIIHNDGLGSSAIGAYGNALGARGIQQGIYYAFADYIRSTLSLKQTNTGGDIQVIPIALPGSTWATGEDYTVSYSWNPDTHMNTILVTDKVGGTIASAAIEQDLELILNSNLGYIAISAATGDSFAEQTVEIDSISNG